MTDVFDFVQPAEVEATFAKLKTLTDELTVVHMHLREADTGIKKTEAELDKDPDFTWGKNPTIREAQSRDADTQNWHLKDTTLVDIERIEGESKLVRLDIEKFKLIRSLFNTEVFDEQG